MPQEITLSDDAMSMTIMFVGLGFFVLVMFMLPLIHARRNPPPRIGAEDHQQMMTEAHEFGYEGSRLQKMHNS